MKFRQVLILLALLFQLASLKSSSQSKASFIAENLNSSAQTYAPFARLAYCPRAIISDFKCEFCNEFAEDYATYFIHSAMYNNNRLFQLVVVYSDTKREIVISFSGPKEALKEIYESGYVMIPELGNIKMEREFWEVYSLNFRQVLSQKIQQITESGRGDYTFIFLGHSAGGSLATLAAYDMVNSNVVIKTATSPKVYTYGQLSIGDDKFVKNVNKLIKVVRIVKNDDYVARSVKYCSHENGKYVCSKPKVQHKVYKVRKHVRVPYVKKSVKAVPIVKKVVKKIKTVVNKKKAEETKKSVGRKNKVVPKKDTKKKQKSSFLEISKDPIVRGTTFINGQLVQTQPPMFSQPIGTEVIYGESSKLCSYSNGIPLCEKKYVVPTTFTSEAHQSYYNMNMQLCK